MAIIKSLEDITTAHRPPCLRLIIELSPAGVVNLVIVRWRTRAYARSPPFDESFENRGTWPYISARASARVFIYFNTSRNNPASSPSRFRPRLTSSALRLMITRGFDHAMPESESRGRIGRRFDLKSGIREQQRERGGELKAPSSSSSWFPVSRPPPNRRSARDVFMGARLDIFAIRLNYQRNDDSPAFVRRSE